MSCRCLIAALTLARHPRVRNGKVRLVMKSAAVFPTRLAVARRLDERQSCTLPTESLRPALALDVEVGELSTRRVLWFHRSGLPRKTPRPGWDEAACLIPSV